jgi:hypothetical protein
MKLTDLKQLKDGMRVRLKFRNEWELARVEITWRNEIRCDLLTKRGSYLTIDNDNLKELEMHRCELGDNVEISPQDAAQILADKFCVNPKRIIIISQL